MESSYYVFITIVAINLFFLNIVVIHHLFMRERSVNPLDILPLIKPPAAMPPPASMSYSYKSTYNKVSEAFRNPQTALTRRVKLVLNDRELSHLGHTKGSKLQVEFADNQTLVIRVKKAEPC